MEEQTPPYILGLLGFREAPSLVHAFERLQRRPDVLNTKVRPLPSGALAWETCKTATKAKCMMIAQAIEANPYRKIDWLQINL
ncbi:endonuclease V [Candidatus Protochlamydia amoebophila]|uniref:endonuclease V n=1 Tax=Candidatus Protochlamydia amoebophila TaxID=362787 RepID=UPI003B968AC1